MTCSICPLDSRPLVSCLLTSLDCVTNTTIACSGLSAEGNGLCSALTRRRISMRFGARNSTGSMGSTSAKAVVATPSRFRSSGTRFSRPRSRLVTRPCSTRMPPTVRDSLVVFVMLAFTVVAGKSNQQNVGTITSSNLCTEIIEYSSPDETAVCNLASIALPSVIEDGKSNFQKLHDVAKVVAFNLNRIIDKNYNPIPEARRSNMRHRPIGVGLQGLADAFMALRLPFDAAEARRLNLQIFETIYHAAVEASCEMAKKDGPYETTRVAPLLRASSTSISGVGTGTASRLRLPSTVSGNRCSLRPCRLRRRARFLATTSAVSLTPGKHLSFPFVADR